MKEPTAACVLIVDDEPANLLALEAILEAPGVELVRAASGEEALRKAAEADFAAILLDVRMPGIDGFETARRLRASGRTHLTPILFITASLDAEQHIDAAYALGAVDFLAKPVRSAVLQAKVAFFIELYRSREDLKAAEARNLRIANERARVATDAGRLHIWMWEPGADRAVWEDKATYELFGIPLSDEPLSAERFATEFVHPQDVAEYRRATRATIENGEPMHFQGRFFRRPGNELRWIEITGRMAPSGGDGPPRVLGTATDITERKRIEERLRSSDERYRVLFESVDEGFCLLEMIYDAQGKPVDYRFLEANRAFEEQTGLLNAVGKTIREFAPGHEQHWFDLFSQVAETGRPTRFVNEARALNRWYDVYATRVGETGSHCVAVLFSDITAKKQADDDLRRLATELAASDRRKTEFLATLAHELRNPLTPISNGLQVMRLGAADPVVVENARRMMERQVSHMVRLVDDLLDIARVTVGKVELRRETVALRKLVDAAVETAAPAVAAAQLTLQVVLPGHDMYLHVDAVRIAQVLGNLLSNSAKYTPPGGRITLAAHREGGIALIDVTDTGVGIEEGEMADLFEMFTQVGSAIERSQGGLGIGLSLVRQLVLLHGGTVTVHSQGKDRGSTFTVRLPLAEGVIEKEQTMGISSEQATAQRFRVLVVDDNADAADSLATLLEMIGHETRVAHGGPQALEIAPGYVPEVVFLDIGMPGMNGYEVAGRLRQVPGMKDGVLVALTGWGADSDRDQARQAGFDHHLTKPAELDAVEGLLAGLGRH